MHSHPHEHIYKYLHTCPTWRHRNERHTDSILPGRGTICPQEMVSFTPAWRQADHPGPTVTRKPTRQNPIRWPAPPFGPLPQTANKERGCEKTRAHSWINRPTSGCCSDDLKTCFKTKHSQFVDDHVCHGRCITQVNISLCRWFTSFTWTMAKLF